MIEVAYVFCELCINCVGKSSRRRDPVEVSGSFWNNSLVYKFKNSLDILIGLQRNTPYSKSNQLATGFLRHVDHLIIEISNLLNPFLY